MISKTTQRFWNCFSKLPEQIQERAQKAYNLFSENNRHPSLRFKKINDNPEDYSVRINQDYRALGVLQEDTIIWFWIGSHSDYESMIKNL